MSWAAATSEGQEITAAVEAVLRRRRGPEELFWRLRRPRAHVYAREAVRVLIYRVAAAAAAVVAITLCAFLGMVAGNIGTPRWPPLALIGTRTVTLAAVHAATASGTFRRSRGHPLPRPSPSGQPRWQPICRYGRPRHRRESHRSCWSAPWWPGTPRTATPMILPCEAPTSSRGGR